MVNKLFNPHMLKVIFVTFMLKGGLKLPLGVSQPLDQLETKFQRLPFMFSGSNFSMVLPVTLPDETGSQKSKMAAEIM